MSHEGTDKTEHDAHNASDVENIVIIGSGISGSTAAIYAARASLKPLVISGPQAGGQLTMTTDINNFPGFPEGIQGTELVENAKLQAEKAGARYVQDIVLGFERKEDCFELLLEDEKRIKTRALIVATGASARWLGLPAEKKFKGRGVSVCATCDGFFYKGKDVVVAGGGDSAMEEATYLAKIAKKVTIIHRSDSFRASQTMQDKVFHTPNISVIWSTEIVDLLGDNKGLTGAKIKNKVTGEVSEIKCDGIFLALGHVPNSRLFKGILDMDEQGYIITESTKTNVPGIFSSGDVQDTKYKQAITAAGTGAQAAIEAERYLKHLKHHN